MWREAVDRNRRGNRARWKTAVMVGWATAGLNVADSGADRDRMTRMRSRGSSIEPLAELDQGLGQECACDEPFGRLNKRAQATLRSSRVGWSSQPIKVAATGCSRPRFGTTRSAEPRHALGGRGFQGFFRYVSPRLKVAPSDTSAHRARPRPKCHRRRKPHPSTGRLIVNAIIPDTTQDANTSNDIRPRTRRSPDAPAHSGAARAAVRQILRSQARNSTKTWTALPTATSIRRIRRANKSRAEAIVNKRELAAGGRRRRNKLRPACRRDGEGNGEGDSFGNARRKETRNED
jgi:hypothetical protein